MDDDDERQNRRVTHRDLIGNGELGMEKVPPVSLNTSGAWKRCFTSIRRRFNPRGACANPMELDRRVIILSPRRATAKTVGLRS